MDISYLNINGEGAKIILPSDIIDEISITLLPIKHKHSIDLPIVARRNKAENVELMFQMIRGLFMMEGTDIIIGYGKRSCISNRMTLYSLKCNVFTALNKYPIISDYDILNARNDDRYIEIKPRTEVLLNPKYIQNYIRSDSVTYFPKFRIIGDFSVCRDYLIDMVRHELITYDDYEKAIHESMLIDDVSDRIPDKLTVGLTNKSINLAKQGQYYFNSKYLGAPTLKLSQAQVLWKTKDLLFIPELRIFGNRNEIRFFLGKLVRRGRIMDYDRRIYLRNAYSKENILGPEPNPDIINRYNLELNSL